MFIETSRFLKSLAIPFLQNGKKPWLLNGLRIHFTFVESQLPSIVSSVRVYSKECKVSKLVEGLLRGKASLECPFERGEFKWKESQTNLCDYLTYFNAKNESNQLRELMFSIGQNRYDIHVLLPAEYQRPIDPQIAGDTVLFTTMTDRSGLRLHFSTHDKHAFERIARCLIAENKVDIFVFERFLKKI